MYKKRKKVCEFSEVNQIIKDYNRSIVAFEFILWESIGYKHPIVS